MTSAQRCIFTGCLACEPDARLEGAVGFELREVFELDASCDREVRHPYPVRVLAHGELAERVLDELRAGDRVLISAEPGSGEHEMEAFELLSRPPQKKIVAPKVWAVADGTPFEPTIL